MKTLKKIHISVVEVEEMINKEDMKENTFYVSEKYGTAVHLCLCGCGNLSVTPINKKGWKLDYSRDGKSVKITMAPSILNKNCPNTCHYVVKNSIANILG